MKIKILDCTLRDGGYVNNWRFGYKTKKSIVNTLDESNIDIIEVGFLTDLTHNSDDALYSSSDEIDELISGNKNQIAAMIALGEKEMNPISLPLAKDTILDIIRITFHNNDSEICKAIDYAGILMKKGYDVCMQPVGTTTYSDEELLSLIGKINKLKPYAFYLVDTLGSLSNYQLMRYLYLIDYNLNKEIYLGFHSHNNLQLSFSNAQALISFKTYRNIIIDSSIFGMGRGAGNLSTELIARHINETIEDKYDLIPILEAMDEYIMPIYVQHPWGYSIPYYIAAVNNCHPNYATFLINKQTMLIKDINALIKKISNDKKYIYDGNYINNLYVDYLAYSINDDNTIRQLSEEFSGKKVLILAPGKSLLNYGDVIQEYIKVNNPLIVSINHVPSFYKYDYIFVGNLKRFKQIDEPYKKSDGKIICTSNIKTNCNVLKINYSDYLNDDELICDNSGLMLINLLKKLDVDSISLAGYDGFDYSATNNYYDENMINNVLYEEQKKTNSAIINYFRKIKRSMKIEFITPTIYDKEDNNE